MCEARRLAWRRSLRQVRTRLSRSALRRVERASSGRGHACIFPHPLRRGPDLAGTISEAERGSPDDRVDRFARARAGRPAGANPEQARRMRGLAHRVGGANGGANELTGGAPMPKLTECAFSTSACPFAISNAACASTPRTSGSTRPRRRPTRTGPRSYATPRASTSLCTRRPTRLRRRASCTSASSWPMPPGPHAADAPGTRRRADRRTRRRTGSGLVQVPRPGWLASRGLLGGLITRPGRHAPAGSPAGIGRGQPVGELDLGAEAASSGGPLEIASSRMRHLLEALCQAYDVLGFHEAHKRH